MNQKAHGFTIVELLIVIVVIGILAAISIVAYNGVSNQANDSAVKSDLRNFASKIQQYHATTGVYPGELNGTSTAGPSGVNFSVSRAAYATNRHNFVYCKNNQAGTNDYIIAAASKSGNRFAYSSAAGLRTYTQNWGGVIDVCTNQGWTAYHVSYGYNNSNNTWWPWTE